jgi:hypothetical protein
MDMKLNTFSFKEEKINEFNKLKNNNVYNDPYNYEQIKRINIANEILKDAKNIMSCEIMSYINELKKVQYIAQITFQYDIDIDERKVILEAENRCIEVFGDDFRNNISFISRSMDNSCSPYTHNINLEEKRLVLKQY